MQRLPTLGQQVYELRKRRGLTQAALAALLGKTSTHIRGIEKDRNAPSLGLLDELGDVLDAELVVGLLPAEDGANAVLLSDRELALIDGFRALRGDRHREVISTLLRVLPERPSSVLATLGALVDLWEGDDLALKLDTGA